MPIPTSRKDVYDLVNGWYSRLTALNIGAVAASAALDTNAAPVVLLHMRINGFLTAVSELQALNLPVETFIGILEEKYRLGTSAISVMLADYVAIRDSIIPDLKAWIESRAEILGDLAASPGLSLPPLSAEDQAELSVKLSALLARFD